MAVLSTADRSAAWAAYMQNVSRLRGVFAGLTKAELLAAVNAIDQWIDDNTASFNGAIPLPARSALSAQQKSDLFLIILRRRTQGN